jgi:hypothetical protein
VGVLSKELIKVSWYFSQKVVPVARQVWRAFCRHGTEFIALRSALPTVAERRWGRGTRLLSGRESDSVAES